MMNVEHKEEIQRAQSNHPPPRVYREQEAKSRYGAHQRGQSESFPKAGWAPILNSTKDYSTFRFSKRAANVLSPLNARDFGLRVRKMSNTFHNPGFNKSKQGFPVTASHALQTYNEPSANSFRLGQREQHIRAGQGEQTPLAVRQATGGDAASVPGSVVTGSFTAT